MKLHIVVLQALLVCLTSCTSSTYPKTEPTQSKPETFALHRGIPIGFLGYPVGTSLSVEGQKVGFNTSLRVTKVNGKPLENQVMVWVDRQLPDGRLDLVGYELPYMIGQPPATLSEGELSINPHGWSMESKFVILSGLGD